MIVRTIANKLIEKFSQKRAVSFLEERGSGKFEYAVLSILLPWSHNGSSGSVAINYSISRAGIVGNMSLEKDQEFDIYTGSSIDEAYRAVIRALWRTRTFGSERVYKEK